MANKDTRIRKSSKKTGITQGYISRVLNGKRNPRFTVACQIADSMHITLDGLRRTIDMRRAAGVDPEVSAKISEGVKAARRRKLACVNE